MPAANKHEDAFQILHYAVREVVFVELDTDRNQKKLR